MTGLVPAGLAIVTAGNDIGGTTATAIAAVQQQFSADEPDDVPRLDATANQFAVADTVKGTVDHKMARQAPAPAPPIIKTVALPADRQPADLPEGELGIPGVAIAAYQSAATTLAAENPVCAMPWTMLAGIGRVESTHAFGGNVDTDGNPISPVYGPVLDGSLAGNNVIHDSDDGALDGLNVYDRAVGPMQFLPETWEHYGADGNGDGIADPQNIYDAALTAGKYLCDGGLDMRDAAQRSQAILRYNNSMAYVTNVMAWANSYQSGVAPQPGQLPRI